VELDEKVRAYRLAEVRRRQRENQIDVAKRMKVSQSRLPRIERGDLRPIPDFCTGSGGAPYALCNPP
jgi:DNA-binding XRE family transcriptional regulator